MGAFEDLCEFARGTTALGNLSALLEWDRETMMPAGGAGQRAEECAALESVLHARRTDPRLGQWLEAAEPPDEAGAALIRLVGREHRRAVRVPADLAEALARQTSLAQGVWAAARAEDDFPAFAPTLKETLRLRREEAAALADGGDRYDALLEGYEPGMESARLEEMFGSMRPRLVELRRRALEAPEVPAVSGSFDEGAQMELAAEIARRFGYDFERGRIDKSVHPFSIGAGDDVRITTRTSGEDPFNCVYSAIHETGHAAYEQRIDPRHALTPLGQGASMGAHESQSRIYENQLGRSRAFCGWLYGEMRSRFGDIGVDGEDAFHATVNRVHRGYIRTEADEVQYNLHIMLRFDLERALIGGGLEADDLEAAWNERFEADFGYPVDRASNGVLQDVHWSLGLFGYFPTYAIGNVYAGCLHAAMRADILDLDAALAAGDPSAATQWLGDKVQRHGSLHEAADLIERACGAAPTAEPLLEYLEEKFSALYPA